MPESMYITRWGNTGPRVVMVHGGAQGSPLGGERNFHAQQPLGAHGWQLIVPDRPGHGRSPSPGRPDDAQLDGALVAELLDDGAHLVGHSFGACVALAAATMRPAVVRSLTFIEPGMQRFATSDPHVRRLGRRLLMTLLFSTSAARRAMRAMTLLGIPPEIRDTATPADLKRLGQGLAKGRMPTKATFARQLDVIKNTGIPLLVVSGGWSPAFEATSDIVAAAAHGKRAVVSSGHHFPQWQGEQFNRILETFMRGHDRRAQPVGNAPAR